MDGFLLTLGVDTMVKVRIERKEGIKDDLGFESAHLGGWWCCPWEGRIRREQDRGKMVAMSMGRAEVKREWKLAAT